MSGSDREPTRRFSERADYYVKFRPHYPPEIIPFLEEAVGLTPGWNFWDNEADALARGYGALWPAYGIDCDRAVRRGAHGPIALRSFFAEGEYGEATFENRQRLTWEGLRGRALSASYAPLPGHSKYQPLMDALRDLFEQHAEKGVVRFNYQTHLYYGRPG